MNTSIATKDSIENITVQSLDESLDGLKNLIQNSIACGKLILVDPQGCLPMLRDLVENVRNFYIFENEVRALFQINGQIINDAAGDITEAEEVLSNIMNEVVAELDQQNMPNLAAILTSDLPPILTRFIDLLPKLRQHIYHEYIMASC